MTSGFFISTFRFARRRRVDFCFVLHSLAQLDLFGVVKHNYIKACSKTFVGGYNDNMRDLLFDKKRDSFVVPASLRLHVYKLRL